MFSPSGRMALIASRSFGRQFPLGNIRNHAMTEPAPRQNWRCGLRDYQQNEGDDQPRGAWCWSWHWPRRGCKLVLSEDVASMMWKVQRVIPTDRKKSAAYLATDRGGKSARAFFF